MKNNKYAVILHLHYIELLDEFCAYLAHLEPFGFDFYVSVTSADSIDIVKNVFPNAFVTLVENLGQDILPFIVVANTIQSNDYTAICKIHSKRSAWNPNPEYGRTWRQDLCQKLLGSPAIIENILNQFETNPRIGLIGPQNHLHPPLEAESHWGQKIQSILKLLEVPIYEPATWVAGTMFWFRMAAIEPLLTMDKSSFAADFYTAHTIERLFGPLTKCRGYTIESC